MFCRYVEALRRIFSWNFGDTTTRAVKMLPILINNKLTVIYDKKHVFFLLENCFFFRNDQEQFNSLYKNASFPTFSGPRLVLNVPYVIPSVENCRSRPALEAIPPTRDSAISQSLSENPILLPVFHQTDGLTPE